MQTSTRTELQYAIRARLNNGMSETDALVGALRECGPLRTVRVSSAQARGAAKKYAYYGAVRYAVRIGRDGRLHNVALERASSDRRSVRLAEKDAENLAIQEDRVDGIYRIGAVSVRTVLGELDY